MKFERLRLHNFGPYRGETELRLDMTSGSRPIILIGGMNGAGKSTLMDAIQLAFFGKLARCPGRRESSYDDFLRRCVHRSAVPQEARIQLEFTSVTSGTTSFYCLDRSWTCNERSVRERFEVRRGDDRARLLPDRLLTESWPEHVENWLPSSLAELFFFDGEQLEALADASTSASVLKRAVEALLGLDLVSQLGFDLGLLQRDKEKRLLAPASREQLSGLETQLRATHETRSKVRQELGDSSNAIASCRKDLATIDRTLSLEGGDLFESRAVLEAEHGEVIRLISATEHHLRELAAGPAPLLLVRPLLDAIASQCSHEEAAERAALITEALEERDASLMGYLANSELPAAVLSSLEAHLARDRDERRSVTGTERYLSLTGDGRETLRILRDHSLAETVADVDATLVDWRALQERAESCERRRAAIPSAEALHELLTSRDERRIALQALETRHDVLRSQEERLSREIDRLEADITSFRREHREAARGSEDAARAVMHMERVQGVLKQFRQALLLRNTSRIEALALENLQHLLRKKRLVEALRVDPQTFEVTLVGEGAEVIPVARLSAGERQLLATALLWALRRAANRVVPLVIDTPLGRLDSEHRAHLVRRYFPHASHQTILLSTDQEIVGPHYHALRPYVAAEITLANDATGKEAGILRDCYFADAAGTAHVN